VGTLTGLTGIWLTRQSPARRAAAWVLAIAGPVVVTAALIPFRSSLSLGGFFFCMLVVALADAAVGGTRPALTTVALGAAAGAGLYDRSARIAGTDLVSLIAFVAVGAAVGILIGELAQLAGEQASSRRMEAALRRVATLVARAAPADELFAAVAEQVGRLLAADYARVAGYEPDDMLTVISTWTRAGLPFSPRRVSVEGENVSTFVLRTGRPARIDDFAGATGPLAEEARAFGVRCTIGAPIIVEGRIWGVMTVGAIQKWTPPPDIEERLSSFTDLVATAISNADTRAAVTWLAEEQAALRRVATLVARGAPPEELFEAVTAEAGQLLQADQTTLCRYEPDGTATSVAGWRRSPAAVRTVVGRRLKLGGKNLTTIVSQTCRAARIDSYADASGVIGAAARGVHFRSAVGSPILVKGRLWGVVLAGSSHAEPLGPETEARLTSFTDLVATAISNADNLTELTASRARVVATADETRRRIERDLHDGAQQRLISLGLALRAAQTEVPPQLGRLEAELAGVADGLASVQDDLQEMARGIHPAILAQGGLEPALKTLARRCTIPVELDLRAGARLPERVEVAAYYVVAEALTNAAKHARASVVRVEAAAAGRALHLGVRDDGTGGADPVRGSGLIGLKDRVEALGGTLTVHSPAGAGTALHAELPLAE